MQGQCIDITMQWQTSCIALMRLLLLEDVGLPVPPSGARYDGLENVLDEELA